MASVVEINPVNLRCVMAGFSPAIHAFFDLRSKKAWTPGPSPGVTQKAPKKACPIRNFSLDFDPGKFDNRGLPEERPDANALGRLPFRGTASPLRASRKNCAKRTFSVDSAFGKFDNAHER